MTVEEIEAIKSGADAPLRPDMERFLLRALDLIATKSEVDEEAWDILAAHFNRQQLLDLLFTIGNYGMVAMAMNTFRASLAPGMSSYGPPQPTALGRSMRPPSRGNPDQAHFSLAPTGCSFQWMD